MGSVRHSSQCETSAPLLIITLLRPQLTVKGPLRIKDFRRNTKYARGDETFFLKRSEVTHDANTNLSRRNPVRTIRKSLKVC